MILIHSWINIQESTFKHRHSWITIHESSCCMFVKDSITLTSIFQVFLVTNEMLFFQCGHLRSGRFWFGVRLTINKTLMLLAKSWIEICQCLHILPDREVIGFLPSADSIGRSIASSARVVRISLAVHCAIYVTLFIVFHDFSTHFEHSNPFPIPNSNERKSPFSA